MSVFRKHATEFNEAALRAMQIFASKRNPLASPNVTVHELLQPFEAAIRKSNAWVANHLAAKFILRCIPALCLAGSIFSIYKRLSETNGVPLSKKECTSLVVETVTTVYQSAEFIHILSQEYKAHQLQKALSGARETLERSQNLNRIQSIGTRILRRQSVAQGRSVIPPIPMKRMASFSDLDGVLIIGRRTAPLLDNADASAIAPKSEPRGFERLFKHGKVMGCLRILGAMASVAMVGCSIWELCNDISEDKSGGVIACDAIMIGLNTLAAAVFIAELFIPLACLPAVGFVLLVAGLIVGLISYFADKPKNPLDRYIKEVGIPFVDKIEPATGVTAMSGKLVQSMAPKAA
ncbi:MAG: hypothetical protein HY055_08180 [Magnetospirillum sp.]|nr:hypothetical protein [Magnetospirillum sp.]